MVTKECFGCEKVTSRVCYASMSRSPAAMARRVFLSRSTKWRRDDEPLEPQARCPSWIPSRTPRGGSRADSGPQVLPPARATVPPWLPAKSARVSNLLACCALGPPASAAQYSCRREPCTEPSDHEHGPYESDDHAYADEQIGENDSGALLYDHARQSGGWPPRFTTA